MYLELIIQKNNEEDFQAKCPLFPNCKGNGASKDEAIKRLCRSISHFISRQTSSFFKKKLMSNDYSEIVSHPDEKDKFQHRVINLLPESANNKYKVFLKSLDQFSSDDNVNISSVDDEIIKLSMSDTFQQDNKDDNSLLFGISLCLN